MNGLEHVSSALLWHLAELEGRDYNPTAPHLLSEAYDEGVNRNYDGYFHLKNSQLEELLYQLAIVQQPANKI